MRITTNKLLVAFPFLAPLAGCGRADDVDLEDVGATPRTETTPSAFKFVDQTDVAAGAQMTSTAVTITGINAPARVTVTGGSHSVGCTADYVTAAGTINNNQTMCVRHTVLESANTGTDTTLTVGGVSDTFTSTTAATRTSPTRQRCGN